MATVIARASPDAFANGSGSVEASPFKSEVTTRSVPLAPESTRAFQSMPPASRATTVSGAYAANADASDLPSICVSTTPSGCVDMVSVAGLPKSVPVISGARTPRCVKESRPRRSRIASDFATVAVAPAKV